ncbi:MAG: exonuclease domain-containing protein [Clostridiales bacterium]|nr:exonuclease domain-containing protein [Clostridiales bacterium]
MIREDNLFPMTFVVFDMEWNQPIPYMPSPVDPKILPGEIIEIGAVKLQMLSEKDYVLSRPFSITVRPQYYRIMNRQVSRVINKSTDDLKCGMPFPEAYSLFQEWCGEDYVLCAWGDSDISILKSNLKIHGLTSEINERFLDIQPLFGRVAENTSQQRSVAYAVDFYKIPQTDDFHSADKDAWYETRILQESLIDYFSIKEKNPDDEQAFPSLRTYISNPNLTTQKKWRSEAFPSEKDAIRATLGEILCCPICDEKLQTEIPWFSSGRTYLSLWQCPQHSTMSGKIRAKKTPKQEFYGSGQLRFVNGNAARYVREKWQEKVEGVKKEAESPEIDSENETKCEQM